MKKRPCKEGLFLVPRLWKTQSGAMG
jgi:hypothetical protein